MDENLNKEAEKGAEQAPAKKKSKKNRLVITGVVVAVLVVLGAGFWVWHEQPSFCNAICHTPMDPYYDTYASGEVDRNGNAVANPVGMLAYAHANYSKDGTEVSHGSGMTCMSCHIPTIGEQVSEAAAWISGNYVYPLEEKTLDDLVAARGLSDSTEFCMNDACHSDLRDKTAFVQATAALSEGRNPHSMPHGTVACTDCHNAHTVSVNACSQCHNDSPLPEGWLSTQDYKKVQSSTAKA